MQAKLTAFLYNDRVEFALGLFFRCFRIQSNWMMNYSDNFEKKIQILKENTNIYP